MSTKDRWTNFDVIITDIINFFYGVIEKYEILFNMMIAICHIY